jgi:rhodanese-related sulfurtransferase
MLNDTSLGYAGDIDPKDAFQALAKDASAVLVDVRTVAEWTFVGLPALQSIAKEPILLEWQRFPSMGRDPDFETKLTKLLTARGAGPGTPIYFLCRSGGRSRDAAIALTDVGYNACFNVSTGFEGPPDEHGHRGNRAGWKASGLPWAQS